MDDAQNPYGALPTVPPESKSPATPPRRLTALVCSVVSGFVGAVFGYGVLVLAVFATLINPAVTGREWWRMYADNVLFGDGWWQIIPFAGFLFVSICGFAACLLQLLCALIRKPGFETSLIWSSCFALASTALIIGGLLFLRG